MIAGKNEVTEDRTAELSDQMLVATAKSGDREAFALLSSRHARRIFYEAYRITGNKQDAEDALQDSFMRAYAHLDNFQEKSSFSTWLTRIAINSALMVLRKQRGRCEVSIDTMDDPGVMLGQWKAKSSVEDPESSFVRREREELLGQAILRLSPLVRETFELRRTRDCSVRDLARKLGISVPAVKARLWRARVTLRNAIL